MNGSGAFIVLEGIDGSGTTTQASLLEESLGGLGLSCRVTREPTSGPVGRLLRAALTRTLEEEGEPVSLDWVTLALLFSADRADHVRREILPAVKAGEVVICDRYDLSSLIYQSETSPHPEETLEWLRQLNRQALRPDLVFVLDVPPGVAEARRAARGGAEELFEKRELQRRLAAKYAQAPDLAPDDPIVMVQGEQTVAALNFELTGLVRAHLPELFAANLPPHRG